MDELDERSDIYSVGAMLYTLLAGQMPYVDDGPRPSSRAILEAVIAGPPRALYRVARSAVGGGEKARESGDGKRG